MVIPTTGPISLTNIQEEFGGTNPISISEYYRGGAYVTTNNTNVPTSGLITMNSFRGAYKTTTAAELSAAIASTPYADYRNKLFSKMNIVNGFETNTGSTFTEGGTGAPTSATSVTGSLTFSSSWVAGAIPFLKVSYITIILSNYGVGAGLPSLTLNGGAQTMTTVFSGVLHDSNGRLGLNYIQIPVTTESYISGMQASATYTKNSANFLSHQQLLVLPGKWDPVANVGTLNTIGNQTVGATIANDLVLAITGNTRDTFENSLGTLAGVSGTEFMRRGGNWYNNCSTQMTRVLTNGTAVYNNGSATTQSSDSTVTDYRGSRVTIWRCTQP